MNYIQTVAPTSEPISLTEAKHFIRAYEDETQDDSMIEAMIKTAREYAENYTNRQLMTATFELITSKFIQDMKLQKNPIQSISKIEYMDENGDYQTLSTDNYYLYFDAEIGKIHFEDLPSIKDDKRAVKITFISGYTTVPSSILHYIKLTISTMYKEKDLLTDFKKDDTAKKLYIKLLDMYRIQPL